MLSAARYPEFSPSLKGAISMDKDRIQGAAQQAKGSVKEVAGKVTGDAKLESEGKVDKFFKESALLDQAFIREPERSVTDRIKDTEKTIGSAVTVVSFIRFELGAE